MTPIIILSIIAFLIFLKINDVEQEKTKKNMDSY